MSKKSQNIVVEQSSDPYKNCLLTLLDSLGWSGEKRFINEAMPVQIEMMGSQEFLLTTMANLGYRYSKHRSSVQKAREFSLPSLFTHKNKAYVLLHKENNGVFAYDGENKKYTIITDLGMRGEVYTFNEIAKEEKTLMDQNPYWFTNLLARFKTPFIAFVIISFLISLLMVVSPLFIMFVYDQIKYKTDSNSLTMLGGAVIIYTVAFGAAVLAQSAILRLTSIRIGNIVNNQVVRRIFYLPLSYTEITSMASHMARLKDFLNIQSFFGGAPFSAICEFPFTMLLLIILYFLGGNIVVIPICTIILFFVFCIIIKRFVSKLNLSVAGAGIRKQELLIEILTSYLAIKHSGKRKFWSERYKEATADCVFQKYKDAKMNGVITVVSSLLVSLSALATIYIGVIKVLNNEMSPGGLMATMILVWRILAPIRSGFSVLSQTTSIFKSIAQLNRLMNMPLDIERTKKDTTIRDFRGDIDIKQVYLRYMPDAEPALVGVDAAIQHGETLLICGHEGSGKSSLLKLITHLYTFQSGHISIDKLNIKQLQPVTLRKSITFLPQYINLFSGTLESNMRSFNPAATRKDMDEVLRQVGLYDDIAKMPDGLDTVINEDNKKLFPTSFTKLFFIASALLRKSKLMVIDEGTKDLNSKQLKKIINLFKELKSVTTFIFITNQPAVFDIADKILWLDKGRVRKFGSKDEIINEYFEAGV